MNLFFPEFICLTDLLSDFLSDLLIVKTLSEHLGKILPSDQETFSEHVLNSMKSCTVDEFIPCYCIHLFSCKSCS